MALVSKNFKIPSKDPQIRSGENSTKKSGGKKKEIEEGKKETSGPIMETSSTSNESKAIQIITKKKKDTDKNMPEPEKDATHGDDPETADSQGEDENDEEESEEDKAERERYLAGGREANRKLRHGESKLPRPKPIEKQWRQLYTVVKTWWTNPKNDLSHHQKLAIDKLQKRIESECEDLARINNDNVDELKRMYKFPVDTLHGHISTAAAALDEVEGLERLDEDEAQKLLVEKEKVLVEGLAVITGVLQEHQIPAPCVVTQNALDMFDRVVNKNEKTREHYANTIAELNKPTAEQEQAWTVAIPEMEKALEVMKADDRTSTGKGQLESHIDMIKQANKLLESGNENMGLKTTTNCLPIDLLQRMQQQWTEDQQSELANSWDDLIKVLESQALAKDINQGLYKEKNNKKKALKSSSNRTEPPQTDSSVPPSTGVPKSPDTSKRPANVRPQGSAKQKDYLSMQLSELDVISVPDYSSGMTEFGSLVAVRLSHTGNPRFSRFILSAGTSKLEHYRVIRGTDLGPGGAEALEDCDNGLFHYTFDLRKRKSELKTNRITAIGPCVILPRANDYKPGPRSRRPDAYVKVAYANKNVDWVTRTEFMQLVGRKYAETKLAILEGSYEEKVKFFEAHKQARVDPETKQPLNPERQKREPWLFPANRLLDSMEATGTSIKEEEDVDMTGVHINV